MAHPRVADTVRQILRPLDSKSPMIMHEAPRMADERKSAEHVALTALFIAFLKVSLCSFGGGLAWVRRIAVEQRHWINEEEFADILSLCQFLLGPNIVGIAVGVGAKIHAGVPRRRLFTRWPIEPSSVRSPLTWQCPA
jgi:hypothetical protein